MADKTIKCPKCNEMMPNVYRFCLRCGVELTPRTVSMSFDDPLPDFAIVTPKSVRPLYLVSAIMAGAILAGGLIGGTYYLTRPAETADRQSTESTPSPSESNESSLTPPVPSRKPVNSSPDPTPEDAPKKTDKTLDLKSGSAASNIPEGAVVILDRRIHIAPKSYFAQEFKVANDARLRGTFDSTSPVELSVITQQGSELYRSARINEGSMDVNLRPGKYYLLIENRFSWITGKDVKAVIYMQYF